MFIVYSIVLSFYAQNSVVNMNLCHRRKKIFSAALEYACYEKIARLLF